ncbi:MAG: DUF4169 family protein [Pseudomonadota bacterium]
MADLVNLRQVRKRKARDEKSRQADHNRAVFGRRKSDRDKQQAERDLAARRLDGHLRDVAEIPGDTVAQASGATDTALEMPELTEAAIVPFAGRFRQGDADADDPAS